jgi:2-polyprenyl-6-methoxyphenol hydroxylase-like FAD-dependent oxidoreductase
MSLTGKHVIVVGGGIGGAVTALLSARAGARVTLLEQYEKPHTVPSGLLLQPNGLAVLYGLDLDERLLRRGTRLSSLRVADPNGRTIVELKVPRFGEELDHVLVIRRDELLASLFDLIGAEPGIDCHFDTEVLAASADGTVLHRSRGGTHQLVADVVVGADGVHSVVRRHSKIPASVGSGLRYVRGLGPELSLEGMTEYWTGIGVFGVAPLRHASYFYASTHAEPLTSALREHDIDYFRETWQRELPVAGEVLAGVRCIEDMVASYVLRVDCARWSAGRVVLIGDAAHAMAPNLGQGCGSALADAAVLVWELARPGDTADAFARFEARRRPDVRGVQDVAGLLSRLSDVTNPIVRVLRDRGLHLLGPWLLGEVGMRFVEQQDPLWLRIAAQNPTEDIGLP